MRRVHASRYVLPFREGGSVPALVEGDDLGLYVVKLRGAAQGPKALIAELVSGEIARAVGLAVPEIVLVDLDRALAAAELDPEIFQPLEASAGVNLGLDFLPGSITFDPVAGPIPDASTASRIVLFDAFVMNVDRTPRNTNLLNWHKRLWLIDHGASLYFHHAWPVADPLETSTDPFALVRDHVLLKWATKLGEAGSRIAASITPEVIDRIVAAIPATWLDERGARDAYAGWLRARLGALSAIVEEAERGRALLV